MASYHVFIDRARDPSPDAVRRTAAAIAQRYGLPADAIHQRMSQGRFRVKANIDLATAQRFAADLESLGAVCTIQDDAGNAVGAGSARPAPAATGLRAATPQPRPVQPRPSEGPLAGIARTTETTEPAGGYQSGLAAAFGETSGDTDLGALGVTDSNAFSLAALDGSEAAAKPVPAAAFAPAHDPSARDDLFRPPEDVGAPKELELAVAAPVRHTPPPMPAAIAPDAPVAPPVRLSATQPGAQPAEPAAPERRNPLRAVTNTLGSQPRIRLLAGVLLAVLLGFIPATLFASWRESSAYAEPRKNVHKAYAEATSLERWQTLDEDIKGEREVMNSSRQTIAITSMLLWGAAGAGFAFVWFRKVPWDRLAE